VDPQADLVQQAVGQQRLGDGPEPVHQDVVAGLLLELGDLLGQVAGDDGGIGPVGLLQGGGGDVLGHGVDLVGEGAGLGRPGLGEGLVGPPPHQQRVAGEQLV
jgi:hypothetical protein